MNDAEATGHIAVITVAGSLGLFLGLGGLLLGIAGFVLWVMFTSKR